MSNDDYEAHEAGELADMAMDELREKAQALADALDFSTDIMEATALAFAEAGLYPPTQARLFEYVKKNRTALAAWGAK